MSIYTVNSALPTTDKIEDLNTMILELEGLVGQAKFDLYELEQIFTDISFDRKFLRNQSLGNTTATYTNWTHVYAESGYSIWKIAPTNYVYNANNQLYFDDKLLTNKGQANSETSTSFDTVWVFNGTTYTDYTSEAGTEAGTEFSLFSTQSGYLYIGLSSTFSGIKFEFQTRGSNYTLEIEYSSDASGTAFTQLTSNANSLVDNTSNFESDGAITWTAPDDFTSVSVNGTSRYWIRISSSTTPVTTAKAYLIIPNNSVIGLLAMSSTQILEEDWLWCSYGSSVYVSIRNTGNQAYEGDYYITTSSSATNKQNFFVYNHEFEADYQDSTYVAGFSSNFNLNYNRIINLADPINSRDAATKSYVDTHVVIENLWDRASGSTTLTPYYANDNIDLGSGNVTTTGTGTFGGLSFSGNLDLNYNKVINLADPTNSRDAATKSYVDAHIVIEEIWDRLSGSNAITPQVANDNLNMGTGVITAGRFVSTIGTGTVPYTCVSSTLNTNLNADLLDGNHATHFLNEARADTWFLNKSISSLNDVDIASGLGIGELFRWDGSRWHNTNAIIIATSNNIGIGTLTPNYKLDVNGILKANDYYSEDGSQGATTSINGLNFKDGLYISGAINYIDTLQSITNRGSTTNQEITVGNKIRVGDGASALDKEFIADIGSSGGGDPRLRYDVGDSKWYYSNDGLKFGEVGRKLVILKVIADDTALTTGDGKMYFAIPPELNGMNLVDADAHVYTVSSSGAPNIQIYNVNYTQNVLSTAITIDANEKDSNTAATPPVINTSYDNVTTGDELRIDVDGAGTGVQGLEIRMSFQY